MELLARMVVIEGGVLLCGFFAVVLYKIVTGTISLEGLLDTKEPGKVPRKAPAGGPAAEGVEGVAPGPPVRRQTLSPARLQLLIFTVVVAAQYLHAIIVNTQRDSLPGLPQGVVAALGGSQALYLGGKALSAYIQPLHRKNR